MQLERQLCMIAIRNEWQKASLNIILTNSLLINGYEEFFKKNDLTAQQYNILRILRDQFPKPISTSVLRNYMLDKMSDTSRLVSRLKTKGLVDVDRNSSDKRLVNILVSDKGLKLLGLIDLELYKLDNLMQGLSEEEAVQLSNLLEKARMSIKTADARLIKEIQEV
ncbi:MarR family transcriptional regulator [Pontibacter sp. JH31]|uniref:MarR family transcriptional regulator n=1 Tax=Pontibacter aquaedesilientis TaxID=2766980 RepID=A0ABR7XEA7_9BACT|nr:MarR family transcriptional regulator [Pontibacter aquaedesilientis]MBD1396241.1 MarR family transcriptional regulator [Pontibacter aquaedesilientis]